jgi:hypothetical protein
MVTLTFGVDQASAAPFIGGAGSITVTLPARRRPRPRPEEDGRTLARVGPGDHVHLHSRSPPIDGTAHLGAVSDRCRTPSESRMPSTTGPFGS